MHAVETPTTPVLQLEAPETTLARLVAITNQYAETGSGRLMIPRFVNDEAPLRYGSPPQTAHPIEQGVVSPPNAASGTNFDWWEAQRKPAATQLAVAAPQPAEQQQREPADVLADLRRVPIVLGRRAIGIAAVRGSAVKPEPAPAAPAPRRNTEAETATRKSGMSERLQQHLADTGDSYKGIRRNKETFRQRLARAGRRLGCLALGTATAFTGIDTLMNHLSN
jgi:hypothetical protein